MLGMDAMVTALITAVVGAVVGGSVAYFFGLHRSRKERLEEKRAEVIAELSRLLFEVQDSYLHWTTLSFPPGVGGDEVVERRVEKAKTGRNSRQAATRGPKLRLPKNLSKAACKCIAP